MRLLANFLRTLSCSWSFGSQCLGVELWPSWPRCCGSVGFAVRPGLVRYFAGFRTEDVLRFLDCSAIIIIFPCLVEKSPRLVGWYGLHWNAIAFQGHFYVVRKLAGDFGLFLKVIWFSITYPAISLTIFEWSWDLGHSLNPSFIWSLYNCEYLIISERW